MADFPNRVYRPRKKEAPKSTAHESVIHGAKSGLGTEIRGRITAPATYGHGHYGTHEYGAGADVAGIYQVRTRSGVHVQVKEKDYWPTNPQLEAQQAWRAIFSAGMTAWGLLSPAEQEVYNAQAKDRPLHGVNIFMTEYLEAH